MKRLRTKLNSQRGETLIEVLASILVASLSVTLLLSGVAASARINRATQQSDTSFYETLTKAENRQTPLSSDKSITVSEGLKTASLPVAVYGDEGLYSYGWTEEDTP